MIPALDFSMNQNSNIMFTEPSPIREFALAITKAARTKLKRNDCAKSNLYLVDNRVFINVITHLYKPRSSKQILITFTHV